MICSNHSLMSHRVKRENVSMVQKNPEIQPYLSNPNLHLLLAYSMFKVTMLTNFFSSLLFLCIHNFALGNSCALNSFSFLFSQEILLTFLDSSHGYCLSTKKYFLILNIVIVFSLPLCLSFASVGTHLYCSYYYIYLGLYLSCTATSKTLNVSEIICSSKCAAKHDISWLPYVRTRIHVLKCLVRYL